MNGLVSDREDVQGCVVLVPKDPDATTKANGIRTTNVVKAKGRVDFLSSKT